MQSFLSNEVFYNLVLKSQREFREIEKERKVYIYPAHALVDGLFPVLHHHLVIVHKSACFGYDSCMYARKEWTNRNSHLEYFNLIIT